VHHIAKNTDPVTSVCTGSLVLGDAGRMKGDQATFQWVERALPKDAGAVPVSRASTPWRGKRSRRRGAVRSGGVQTKKRDGLREPVAL
jgi:putative intracellular protease/amidase